MNGESWVAFEVKGLQTIKLTRVTFFYNTDFYPFHDRRNHFVHLSLLNTNGEILLRIHFLDVDSAGHAYTTRNMLAEN